MKCSLHSGGAVAHTSRHCGWMLIQWLIYLVVMAFIANAATRFYYSADLASRYMARTGSNVSRTMDIGHRWRQEIRASESVTVDRAGAGLTIRTRQGATIRYFSEDQILYRMAGDKPPGKILEQVSDIAFARDDYPESGVVAWRMAISLKDYRPSTLAAQVFHFTAVPQPQRPMP